MSSQNKLQRLFKMNSEDRTRATSYTTEVLQPLTNTGTYLRYKIERKNWLDGHSVRLAPVITVDGADSWSTNTSGVFAPFESCTLYFGGTQVQSINLKASNFLVQKMRGSDLFRVPSEQRYVYGMQNEFVETCGNNVSLDHNQLQFVPDQSVKYTTSAATTYELMLHLKDIFDFFDHSNIPLYALDADIFIEFTLKSSANVGQIAILDTSNNSLSTGYQISSAPLYVNYVRYDDETWNRLKNQDFVKNVTTVKATSRAPGSGSTQVEQALANNQVKRITVAFPVDSSCMGVDNSYLRGSSGQECRIQLRSNGDEFWNQPLDLNRGYAGTMYSMTKEAHEGHFYAEPGSYVDGTNLGTVASILDTCINGPYENGGTIRRNPWGGSTYSEIGGKNSYVCFPFQKDPRDGHSFMNSTRMDDKPVVLEVTHATGISCDSVVMYAETERICQIQPNGRVQLLDGLPDGEMAGPSRM